MNQSKTSPIFIMGCPRSGNTVLGCILNKHPNILIVFEQHLFYGLFHKWIILKNKSNREFIKLCLEKFKTFHDDLNISPKRITNKLLKCEPVYELLLDNYMKLLLKNIKVSGTMWGDKTPHNIFNLDKIVKHFPNAKIIYTFRDPRNVVNSLTKKSFVHASDDFYINSEVVRQYHDKYKTYKPMINKANLYEIKYETLLKNPEKSVKQICQFLDIDYSKKLLEPADNRIRKFVGWPNNKAWDRIEYQDSKIPVLPRPYLEKLLNDIIIELEYPSCSISYKKYIYHYIVLKIGVFRVLRFIMNYFWKKKYKNSGDLYLLKMPRIKQFYLWSIHRFLNQ